MCPYCGSKDFTQAGEWQATSDLDPDNQVQLDEFSCDSCGEHFWLAPQKVVENGQG